MARTRRSLVTLLTDFGAEDGYVGAMKGVIYSQAPGVTVVDLSHDIPPFDVQAAGYVLAGAAYEFPPDTIHVAVVDPGVGSRRRIVVAESDRQRFVVPDNGLLDICRLRHPMQRWIDVTSSGEGSVAAHRPAAPTFHGRDIFAPVAAALARGVSPHRLGRRLMSVPWRLPGAPARRRGRRLEGRVLHIDRFGTLITTVESAMVRQLARIGDLHVRVAGRIITTWVRSYAEAARGVLVVLLGSQDWLEISVVEGSAARRLRAQRGDTVIIEARACRRT